MVGGRGGDGGGWGLEGGGFGCALGILLCVVFVCGVSLVG